MSKNLKIFAEVIEQEAIDQIDLLMAQPAFADCKVRIMPDVHAGAGCVIGFTADLGDKVIPNVVGVDIGCGMRTVKVNGKMDFEKLDAVIREKIPSGMNVRDIPLKDSDKEIIDALRCREHLRGGDYFVRSIGTLGGGNHFIEVDVDADENHYLVIHSGSRNLGKQVADYYQQLAIENEYGSKNLINKIKKQTIRELKEQGRAAEISSALAAIDKKFKEGGSGKTPKQLCYLTGKDREDYLHDMAICQRYATINRYEMAHIIIYEMDWWVDDEFETVHNYIDLESNIVRKGAVSAKYGEKLLIPMNMRDGSLICIGKGNDDWNQSAPHGAGRLMSRREARETLLLEGYRQTMRGIFTTSVGMDTLDEAPEAYKPVSAILPLLGDTVEVVKAICPVYNFKAGE